MANRPAPFTKADVTRAVGGARAAGMTVDQVRVLRDGSILLSSGSGGDEQVENGAADWRARSKLHAPR